MAEKTWFDKMPGKKEKAAYTIIVVLLVVAVVAGFIYLGSKLMDQKNLIQSHRAHKDISYTYLPTGQENMVILETICQESFKAFVGGRVEYRDLSQPVHYVTEGGCLSNELYQTIIWKNGTVTVNSVSLDKLLGSTGN